MTSLPNQSKETRRLISAGAAAAQLGVSIWTVRRLIDAGELPAVRLPNQRTGARRLLIDLHDLEALIAASKE